MKVIRKYEFTNESEANTAIDLLRDEEGNITQSVVRLGNITITPAQYDGEGNEISAAVTSNKYAVDVCWSIIPLESWDAFMVFPTPLGVHSFGSSSQRDEYAARYCELFPDSEYCNPTDLTEE